MSFLLGYCLAWMLIGIVCILLEPEDGPLSALLCSLIVLLIAFLSSPLWLPVVWVLRARNWVRRCRPIVHEHPSAKIPTIDVRRF